MHIRWMDGFGNEHVTVVRAAFVAHDGTSYVVTDHPRDQFRPVMLNAADVTRTQAECDPT